MMIPELGTLVEVALRSAWSHEAYSFTPWLAQHLDLLAKEIGIPLEFEGREVVVDGFSADILARNLVDDSLVLIENQLESTDHTHLGQIMTYLAGLEAQTVIWIASEFHQAHLSAVRWLNDHTTNPYAFFAVKVKVVRIGDSPLAPIFEVLVRPNEWDRQVQAVAEETRSLTEIGQFRKAFWSHYLSRYPIEEKHGKAGADSARWRNLPDLHLVIASFLAKDRVGVFVRGGRGVPAADVYDKLAPRAAQLAELTGAELGNPNGEYFFIRNYPAKTSDHGTWDMLADWLFNTANTYASALQTVSEPDAT